MWYYLTDAIYSGLVTSVNTIPCFQVKKKIFSKYQEGQHKDVERAFGVLQSLFTIIRDPAQFWYNGDLAKIMIVYHIT